MLAMDVMTTKVVTIGADTSVQTLASLLSERGISGVPVVEGDRVIGIVSEGDLLYRAEIGTERRMQPRRSRWFETREEASARDYVKSHGRTVGDLGRARSSRSWRRPISPGGSGHGNQPDQARASHARW
jgi:CBS-domain-containing membrane protein